MSKSTFFFFFSLPFLAGLGVEPRALCILGKHSTTKIHTQLVHLKNNSILKQFKTRKKQYLSPHFTKHNILLLEQSQETDIGVKILINDEPNLNSTSVYGHSLDCIFTRYFFQIYNFKLTSFFLLYFKDIVILCSGLYYFE